MFRNILAKLPALLLAIAACFASGSGPIRAAALAQEYESGTIDLDLLEGKGSDCQRAESRRIRPKHSRHQIYFTVSLDGLRELPTLEAFCLKPLCFWHSPPPILRAPPS